MASSSYPRGWRARRALAAAVLLLGLAEPAAARDEAGAWASLGADRVNLRLGPGKRYPIDWVYTARGLPVRVLRVHDTWREVLTADGVEGWIHTSLLSRRRTGIVREDALLRRRPDEAASARAHVMAGAVVRIRECGPAWCEVQADGHRGHLPAAALWGSDEGPARRSPR